MHRNRITITATIHEEVLEILNEYYNDTCLKSRSRCLERILLEYLHYIGYISDETYARIQEEYTYARY